MDTAASPVDAWLMSVTGSLRTRQGSGSDQVRQILDAAVADGIVASNAAPAVKPPTAPRRRDVHLSDDDIRTIISTRPERCHALVVALVGLGLRISEACGLLVTDIDFLRKTVHVRQQRRPSGELGKLKTASAGVSVVAVSRWLGHSWPEITWRVYSYLMRNDDEVGHAAMVASRGVV